MPSLTPLDFLGRAAEIAPERAALIDDGRRTSWRDAHARARRLAAALAAAGLRPGDRVGLLAPSGAVSHDALFGIPMAGGIVAAFNQRHDAAPLAAQIAHSGAAFLIADGSFAPALAPALERLPRRPRLLETTAPPLAGGEPYDEFVGGGDPTFAWRPPEDERAPLALGYAAGGPLRAVVYTHRGAALGAVANAVGWPLPRHAVYLWTLPMTHANGWGFPWAVALVAGTHVCLGRVTPRAVFEALLAHAATHMAASPGLLKALLTAAREAKRSFRMPIQAMTATAPPVALLRELEPFAIHATHAYAPPETHAPALLAAWDTGWDALPDQAQAAMLAREGARPPFLDKIEVVDPATLVPVPADGVTPGELLLGGDLLTPGYFADPQATARAFAGGRLRTGDGAVRHPDGAVELKERGDPMLHAPEGDFAAAAIEEALQLHPAVAAAAAMGDARPVAYVELKPEAAATADDLAAHLHNALGGRSPKLDFRLGPLPRSATGHIARLRLRDGPALAAP